MKNEIDNVKFVCRVSQIYILATFPEWVGGGKRHQSDKTSYYHIAVYEKDELIGYIDCVSNGVTDAYIQDLMVHPNYQGKGVGTELMNQMIAYLKEKHIYMISIVYEESLKPFYEKFGFYQMLCGQMETFSS